jgi:multicomponent K+:H+ antiporter subunit D
MGLCGAFLTADLFNLFVFFEVLLAASYGLLLHGGTRARHRAALHYVVFNLAGSALFLIAVSLLYGVAGTLNMADLAQKLPLLPPAQARLAQAAVLMLLVVFAVKAALLPLYFWLPDTYAAASAPVAALFAIMTKVGVYAIARTSTLLLGPRAGRWRVWPRPCCRYWRWPPWCWPPPARWRRGTCVCWWPMRWWHRPARCCWPSAWARATRWQRGSSTWSTARWWRHCGSCWPIASPPPAAAPIDWKPGAFSSGWAPLGVVFFAAAVAVAGVPPLAGFMGKALLLQAAGHTPWAGWVVAGCWGPAWP